MQVIKFHLIKFDKSLVFQILDQFDFSKSSNIRSKLLELNHPGNQNIGTTERTNILFYDSLTKRMIKSVNTPEIRLNYSGMKCMIYLRGGGKTSDYVVITKSFSSNQERDISYDLILSTLNDFSEMFKLELSQCL